ncbi:MAG: hypothetical protein AMJ88_18265 [Anaerolineae bacterium SM23_ 63]|nr:MAG: hypothetical protein AMJ88_18265 [Anaerolineae bacterium SM23_ 63]
MCGHQGKDFIPYPHLPVGLVTQNPCSLRIVFLFRDELTALYLFPDQLPFFIKGKFDLEGSETASTAYEGLATEIGSFLSRIAVSNAKVIVQVDPRTKVFSAIVTPCMNPKDRSIDSCRCEEVY